ALERGRRMAVCDKTFILYSRPPYKDDLILIPPLVSVPVDEARAFDCHGPALRSPRETKGANYRATDEAGSTCCGPDGCLQVDEVDAASSERRWWVLKKSSSRS